MAEPETRTYDATSGDDVIFGTAGDDLIDAGDGNDTVYGLAGNDTLFGWNGNDVIDGGDGNDWIFGEGGIDTLTGGAGNDIFGEFDQWLNGDRITDFSIGDLILIRDADFSTFTFSLQGETLSFSGAVTPIFTGGSIILTGAAGATLVASPHAEGGVQIAMTARPARPPDVRNDFNGDGRSDVLWRHDNGSFTTWLANTSGGFASNDANSFAVVPPEWRVVGTGDFNGDGQDDVVWRRTDGAFTEWLSEGNGTFELNDANAWTVLPNGWKVDGVGDFNADGKDDLIWRRDDGAFTTWLAQGYGIFASNDANSWAILPNSWQVAATGDFNGDGRDDIAWRRIDGAFTTWLAQGNGSFASNDANSWAVLPTSWRIEGTGDFNGDGKDDLVWRRDDGAFTTWLAQGNGSFVSNDANSWAILPNSWQVAETGDYNGDGRDDILWRNSNGAFTNWLAQGNGSFASNDANAFTSLTTAWHVQGPDTFWA